MMAIFSVTIKFDFSLNLRVSEVDTPANSADTTITITIVDVSDNAPVCTTRVFR